MDPGRADDVCVQIAFILGFEKPRYRTRMLRETHTFRNRMYSRDINLTVKHGFGQLANVRLIIL